MTQLLKTLPLLAALAAAPAWAAQPDPHAGHNPSAAGKAAPKSDAKPGTHACAMMDGKMAGAAGAPGGKAPDGKMMMKGKDMHCMPAPAAKAAEPPHDHAHPKTAPK